MFAGFPFDSSNPFVFETAKEVLSLAMDALRRDARLRALGVPADAGGRARIPATDEGRVWDLLPLAPEGTDFTHAPHLTVGVHEEWVEAMITFPNAMNSVLRRRLTDIGEERFSAYMSAAARSIDALSGSYPGVVPWFRGIQRRYKNQTIVKSIDALLEFDLRTALDDDIGPKHLPIWLQAGYAAYVEHGSANCQIQVGAQFRYDECPALKEPRAIGALAEVWIAYSPLLAEVMSGHPRSA